MTLTWIATRCSVAVLKFTTNGTLSILSKVRYPTKNKRSLQHHRMKFNKGPLPGKEPTTAPHRSTGSILTPSLKPILF